MLAEVVARAIRDVLMESPHHTGIQFFDDEEEEEEEEEESADDSAPSPVVASKRKPDSLDYPQQDRDGSEGQGNIRVNSEAQETDNSESHGAKRRRLYGEGNAPMEVD